MTEKNNCLNEIINLLQSIFHDPHTSLEWLLTHNHSLNTKPINLINDNPEKILNCLKAISQRIIKE